MRYAGLGVQLAVSLLVFVLAGQWADRKLGTERHPHYGGGVRRVRGDDVLAHPHTQPPGRQSAGRRRQGRRRRVRLGLRYLTGVAMVAAGGAVVAAAVPGRGSGGGRVGNRHRPGAADAARLVGHPEHRDRPVHGGVGPGDAGAAHGGGGGGVRGPARARTARRIHAGVDGGSPRGAPSGRGGHGSSGTLAGRSSDDAFRSTVGGGGGAARGGGVRRAGACGAGARRPAGAGRQAGYRPDRHRPPPRQLARGRAPLRHRRGTCPRLEDPARHHRRRAAAVLDISPTKHLVFMLFAADLVALVFVLSARSIAGRRPRVGRRRGSPGRWRRRRSTSGRRSSCRTWAAR